MHSQQHFNMLHSPLTWRFCAAPFTNYTATSTILFIVNLHPFKVTLQDAPLSAKTALLCHTTFLLYINIDRSSYYQSSFNHSNIKINYQQHSILHDTDQYKYDKNGSNYSKIEKNKCFFPTK